MVKESNIFIGLKKTCLGVLERGEQGDDNETGLKEGGGIEMSIASIYDARSLHFAFEFTLPSSSSQNLGNNIKSLCTMGCRDRTAAPSSSRP